MAQAQLDAQTTLEQHSKPSRKPASKRQKLSPEAPEPAIRQLPPALSEQQLADPELRRLQEENAKLTLQVLALTEQRELSKTKKYHAQAENNLSAVLRIGYRSRVQLEGDCTDERKSFEKLSLKLARAAADLMRQGYAAQGYDMSDVKEDELYAAWKERRERRE